MQKSTPKISVIIPVYNVAPWLKSCLQSVLTQTFSSLEIIAVNDGSTDESGAVLEEFARQDTRLKIITQNNQGPSAARARGVSAAEGDFLSFLDGDDKLPPDYFEKLCSLAEQTGADLVIAPAQRFFAAEVKPVETEKSEVFAQKCVLKEQQKKLAWKDFSAVMSVCGKLMSRVLAEKTDWYVTSYATGEDIFPAVQLLTYARCIAVQPTTAYYYRQNRAGSQSTSSGNRFEGLFDGFLRACRFLKKTGNYPVYAGEFEYIRRVCLLSFMEKYGLTKQEEQFLQNHQADLRVTAGLFKHRGFKFRLRQMLFHCCLSSRLSYAKTASFIRRIAERKN